MSTATARRASKSAAQQAAMPWAPPVAGDAPQNVATPQWFVDECARSFTGKDHFDLDIAAEAWSAKAPLYCDRELDAMNRAWSVYGDTRISEARCAAAGIRNPEAHRARLIGDREISVWLNMEYDSIESWLRRLIGQRDAFAFRVAVALFPVRPSVDWWDELVTRQAWHLELIDGRVIMEHPPDEARLRCPACGKRWIASRKDIAEVSNHVAFCPSGCTDGVSGVRGEEQAYSQPFEHSCVAVYRHRITTRGR